MVTLAFERLKGGDGRAARRTADMTYNIFKNYFSGDDSPSRTALKQLPKQELETKLWQAIAFLRSVPGFGKHADALEALHLLKTGFNELIIKNNPWKPSINFFEGFGPASSQVFNWPPVISRETLNHFKPFGKGLLPNTKEIPEIPITIPLSDPNPGISMPFGSSRMLPADDEMGRYLTNRNIGSENPSTLPESKLAGLLSGKEITKIPFSELGDTGAELKKLFEKKPTPPKNTQG